MPDILRCSFGAPLGGRWIPSNYRGITPDIYIFAIDNYVDEQKVEAAIQTGAKVMLFFSSHHDEKNTIESEVKKIAAFRTKVQDKCVCVDYNSKGNFEVALETEISKHN